MFIIQVGISCESEIKFVRAKMSSNSENEVAICVVLIAEHRKKSFGCGVLLEHYLKIYRNY